MGFQQHVFISYAHIDNKPLSPDKQGWISRFHTSLETLLEMRLGENARIWRDEKLQGNDVFADEIVDQFGKTALLVSVVTPRYIKSEWCAREAVEFCKCADESGGTIVDNKARIFKVLKAPVDSQESLPEVMKDLLGYEFFIFEEGAPLELDPAYGERFAQDYLRKVNKLAYDITQLLKKLEADTNASELVSDETTTATTTIYLAECSFDRRQEREILEGDLTLHGYTVLPDRALPLEESDYVEAVDRLLARSALSIHLVGEHYGAVPDGPSGKSLSELQNECAVQRSQSGPLQRLIWLPESTRSDNAAQQAFIDTLHKDGDAQCGADLITGDMEELKTAIHSTLKKLVKEQADEPGPQAAAHRLIYLICNEKDRKATVALRKFLRNQGFEVVIPVFEGDATQVRESNQTLLATCDAVVVFYGNGNEAWKRAVDSDLKKIMGYRAGKPLLTVCTYLAEPRTDDKDDLIDMEEPGVIDGLAGFDEAAIEPFVKAVSVGR